MTMSNVPGQTSHPKSSEDASTLSGENPDHSRRIRLAAMAMLLISALPDAMVVPVLKELMVDRYGVSVGIAHAFMCINLIGALIVVGMINSLRKRQGTARLIAFAAGLNALFLAAMAMPIGFIPTLAIRCMEGAVDMMVYAMLFDVIARSGPPQTKGRRMGAAATCLMLGIAGGIGIGGFVGRSDATLSLWLGAGACVLLVPFVLVTFRNLSQQDAESKSHRDHDLIAEKQRGLLWPAMVMMFTDRAVAGVLVSTIPLYLASIARFDSATIGGLIGISMLMTALGAWPAGRIADRWGYLRLRLFAGVIYAISFAAIVTTSLTSMSYTIVAMLGFGLAGAALFASSLLVVCRSGRGPAGMAAYHSAGNLGFLIGPVTAGFTLDTLGGESPPIWVYASIIVGFAIMHILGTIGTALGIARVRRRQLVQINQSDELASTIPAS